MENGFSTILRRGGGGLRQVLLLLPLGGRSDGLTHGFHTGFTQTLRSNEINL